MVFKQQQMHLLTSLFFKKLAQKHFCKSKDIGKFYVFCPYATLVLLILDKYEIK